MVTKNAVLSYLLSLLFIGIALGEPSKKQPLILPFGFSEPVWADTVYDTVLFHDDGTPQYYFPLPDIWDDHFFNVRFTAPDSCRLVSAEFYFIRIDEDSTDLPDIYVFADSSTGLYPDFIPPETPGMAYFELPGDSINLHPDPTVVEFDESYNLVFNSGASFHIGWELADTAATDTVLAILADDGIPETSYSTEWWGSEVNAWGTIQAHWGIGVNFMIRALVQILEGDTSYVWLEPDRLPADFQLQGPYPNPFNPETSLMIQLQTPQQVTLNVYDLSGRLVDDLLDERMPAGTSLIRWLPEGLSSGIYLVKLSTESRSIVTKAVLLR
jgi:hypothetical protein